MAPSKFRWRLRLFRHRVGQGYLTLKQRGYLAAFPVIRRDRERDIYAIDRILGASRFIYVPLALLTAIIVFVSLLAGLDASGYWTRDVLLWRVLAVLCWLAAMTLTGLLGARLIMTIIAPYFQLQSTMFKFAYALRTFTRNNPDQPEVLQAKIDASNRKIAQEAVHLPQNGENIANAPKPFRALDAEEAIESLSLERNESAARLDSYNMYLALSAEMQKTEEVTKSIIRRRLWSLALLGAIVIIGLFAVAQSWSTTVGGLFQQHETDSFEIFGFFLNYNIRGSLFGLLEIFGLEAVKLKIENGSYYFIAYMWACRFFTRFFIGAVILEFLKISILPRPSRTFGAAEDELGSSNS